MTTNTDNTNARPRSSWKRCPHCHRNLRTTDYYRLKDGKLASWCKQCQRQAKREWYATRRKRPATTAYDPARGLWTMTGSGYGRIIWTPQMLDTMRRHYPHTTNAEICGMLGISPSTLHRKAREMHLAKTPEFTRQVQADNALLMAVTNRRRRNPTMFTKGHTPWNKGRTAKAATGNINDLKPHQP